MTSEVERLKQILTGGSDSMLDSLARVHEAVDKDIDTYFERTVSTPAMIYALLSVLRDKGLWSDADARLLGVRIKDFTISLKVISMSSMVLQALEEDPSVLEPEEVVETIAVLKKHTLVLQSLGGGELTQEHFDVAMKEIEDAQTEGEGDHHDGGGPRGDEH